MYYILFYRLPQKVTTTVLSPVKFCGILIHRNIYKREVKMNEKQLRIQELKKEKDAVILAHYYVNDEVQEIADYVGDSYYLSEIATKIKEKVLVLCGVRFMGESAKILNPDKKVLMPDMQADCPMAHMADARKIEEIRRKYEDVAVVCYVNSTAELKVHSDVCVTSSNALKIVRALPNKNIFFIPDQHLGTYVASQVPEKNIILNDGYCPVHARITEEEIKEAKAAHPKAKILVHPECQALVTAMADYAGSTSGIIEYASKDDASEFIIVTEKGVLYELQHRNPEKKFYLVNETQCCPDMKKITLDNMIQAIETGAPLIELEETFINQAHAPLKKMLELAK